MVRLLPRMSTLVDQQLARLRSLIEKILPTNEFYARKFKDAGAEAADVNSLADLRRLPLTTKAELIAEQETHPPYGRLLTYPLASYSRMHQTSGSSGKPLRWLDTPKSWDWLLS